MTVLGSVSAPAAVLPTWPGVFVWRVRRLRGAGRIRGSAVLRSLDDSTSEPGNGRSRMRTRRRSVSEGTRSAGLRWNDERLGRRNRPLGRTAQRKLLLLSRLPCVLDGDPEIADGLGSRGGVHVLVVARERNALQIVGHDPPPASSRPSLACERSLCGWMPQR